MSTHSIRPENRREFMNKFVNPYDKKTGNPNEVSSEKYKAGQPEQNRSEEISLRNDTDKDFSIGIKDINEAVDYYFKEVLKPSVIQNNIKIPVPIKYGLGEIWKSVQADGYYRDPNSKLLAPLLVYRRTNLTQNRKLGNKLDGNSAKNIQLFEKKYSRRNVYSNFEILANREQEKEYIASVTPDYVTITYSCIVWTHFVEQMDKLIESLNYASRSYWGNPNKFQFLSDIESFEDQTTISTGEDRLIRSNFNITLNGWLIPNVINKTLNSVNRVPTISKVIFGLETSTTKEDFVATKNRSIKKSKASIIASDSQNITVNQTNYNIGSEGVLYANLTKQVSATSITDITATFSNSWVTAPVGFPATSIDNFTFFCNGQLIEKSAIVSFVESGGNSILTIDPTQLSYSFEETDEIIGIGKFNV